MNTATQSRYLLAWGVGLIVGPVIGLIPMVYALLTR